MSNSSGLNTGDLNLGESMGILAAMYLYTYQKQEYNKNGACVCTADCYYIKHLCFTFLATRKKTWTQAKSQKTPRLPARFSHPTISLTFPPLGAVYHQSPDPGTLRFCLSLLVSKYTFYKNSDQICFHYASSIFVLQHRLKP